MCERKRGKEVAKVLQALLCEYPPICYWANTVVFQLQLNRLKKAKSQAKQSDNQMNL